MNTISKFNPKTYLGKNKLYVAVPNSPRISRVWFWDDGAREYRPPLRKSYMARRYEDVLSGTKRTYRFFDTLEEARRWQNGSEEKASLNSGVLAITQPKKLGPLFKDIVAEWKKRRFPQLALGTQLQYEKIIRLYFGTLLNLPLYEITSQKVDSWLDDLKAEDSPAMKRKTRQSFEHELTLLTTILKYYQEYHDEDLDFRFPIKDRHRDSVKLKRSAVVIRQKNIPEEQFLQFREALSALKNGQLWQSLATVQYYQALRISEAAGLYWEDVHFDWDKPHNSRISIVRSVFWPHKKGLESYVRIGFKNAESNGGIKEQPMFPETFQALRSLHFEEAKGLVFNLQGTHLDYRAIQHTYDRGFKMAGMPYTATHIMRHGGCRRILNQERGDLGVAQQLLGNSSLKTTLVYAKRDASALTGSCSTSLGAKIQ